MKHLKTIVGQWLKDIWLNKLVIILSVGILIIASILNVLAGRYVTRKGVASPPDLILDLIPSIDLNLLFIWGVLLIVGVMTAYIFLFKISKFHVYLSHISLLMLTRSFAMCLTHLKVPENAVQIYWPKFLQVIAFKNDLFFSGHVAFTFIGFLLFKESKIKWFFLISSIVMAATVLLMHVHYSIDVFSAYFITYGTFVMGEKIFKRIYKI